ncbi:hypothetical protein BH23ACI1_BH23ACI1_27130 [soil metagenome]
MSLSWIAVTAAVFSAFVLLHWPITVACEFVIRQIGFASCQRVAAAAFMAAGLAVAA